MTELELRDHNIEWPKTKRQLNKIINDLAKREHDYGTCVYAMSIAAQAAYYYMSSVVGATGFQAGAASLSFISKTRKLKVFAIVDMANLLYPQYCDEEHFPSRATLIQKHKEWLKKEATALLLEKESYANPDVVAHWKYLTSL